MRDTNIEMTRFYAIVEATKPVHLCKICCQAELTHELFCSSKADTNDVGPSIFHPADLLDSRPAFLAARYVLFNLAGIILEIEKCLEAIHLRAIGHQHELNAANLGRNRYLTFHPRIHWQ